MKSASHAAGLKLWRAVPLLAAMLCFPAFGAGPLVSIVLDGAAEVPPVTTLATGFGDIMVTADRRVSGSVKVSGMAPTVAHIHEGEVGRNGPVIVTLTKAAEVFLVPPSTTLTDSQYQSYIHGNLYINVHSSDYPNGEIRAQLRPDAIAMTRNATPVPVALLRGI